MCRLFGFRSVIPSQVHQSLVSAENALVVQSQHHPDGWGVAYYLAGAPHVIKSAAGAVDDQLFKHVSGVVSSETVLAHVRRATKGVLSIINSHPFQYGHWVFAHNGDIPCFDAVRDRLLEHIPPVKRRYILGSTDSEVMFYLLLTHMERRADLHQRGYTVEDIIHSIRETIALIHDITELDSYDPSIEMHLSFIITNGETMVAHQGGKELHYSTYKVKCPERDSCASFAPCCEGPPASGFVNHLIVSSEPLQGQNVWHTMAPGDIVGVDWRMRIKSDLRDAASPTTATSSLT